MIDRCPRPWSSSQSTIRSSASRFGSPSKRAVGVHQRAVARIGQLLPTLDHAPDRQPELRRELEVARVVRRHRHDRAGSVLHQHVVGDPDGDALAVDRVDHAAPERHAGLLAVDVAAVLVALGQRVVDVGAHVRLVLRALRQPQHVGVLGRHHEEGRAEQRVGAGGEDGVVDADLGRGEGDLGALGAPDPVALHPHHVRRPLDRLEVVEQAVGVVGDAEEPLLELARLDRRPAALAAAVDDLLVGEHGLVLRAPVDRGARAVGEPALVELEEDPLGPAVVARVGGRQLARPVERDAPGAELALEGRDRARARGAWMLAALDRVVLGRQPEGVIADRMQDAAPHAPLEVRDRVADRVVLEVPHVRLARRIGQHLGDVVRVGAPQVVVAHLPRALALPERLPLGLDGLRVIAALRAHGARRLAPR